MRNSLNLFTLQQRIFLVKTFYRNDSDVSWVKNNYMLEYGTFDNIPTESLIFEVINLFEETGSVREIPELLYEKQKDLTTALLNDTSLLADVKVEDADITLENSIPLEILNCNAESKDEVKQAEDLQSKKPRTRRRADTNRNKTEATGVKKSTTKETIKVEVTPQLPEKSIKKEEKPSKEQQNVLTCDICRTKCKSKHGMQLHMVLHTEKGRTSCKYCQQVIPTKYQLRVHMKEHHSDLIKKEKQEKATVSCTFCPKTFLQPNQLRQHLMMHSDRKDIICDVCGKAFKRKHTLTQHMNVHTGFKPFKCHFPNCDRAFRDRNSFTIHKRCHADERPFPCEYCGKCFRDKGTLRIHYRQHTGETPYKCELCGKTTKQRQNLQSHMKHFHRINTNKN